MELMNFVNRVKGADRTSFLESLVVADLVSLPENSSTLSVFTTKSGGVLDDTVINKRSDDFYVVANAGCAEKDLKHLRNYEAEWKSQGKDVEIKVLEKALVAVQGPGAVGVLKALADDADALSNMGFMTSREMKLNGMRVYLTRCGYTGEDGYEIQVSNSDATKLVDKILSTPLPAGIASSSGFTKPVLAGLGARDSLRLEAGLCLYGHELSETINPIEAGLTWTIGARRRLDSDETKFLGSETVLSVLRSKKPAQRRVGLIVEGAPARGGLFYYYLLLDFSTMNSKLTHFLLIIYLDGAEIYSLTNSATPIGTVTSGCPSPTLKKNIAMGYVTSGYHAKDTELFVKVRGKLQRAKVVKLPFVPHNYFRG